MNKQKLENTLYNAIVLLFDKCFDLYNGLDDEEFIKMVCSELNITEDEYNELVYPDVKIAKAKKDVDYVIDFARSCKESGHPVEDYDEFEKILADDDIMATPKLWKLYLANI